jgi:hypothetical protein
VLPTDRPLHPRRSPLLVALALTATTLGLAAGPAVAVPAARGWLPIAPPASPPARSAPATAYDPVSRLVVVFGGFSSQAYLNDTWTWDGSTWAPAPSSEMPPVRAAAGVAFDASSRTLVMFGGFDGHDYLDDTWLWDGRSRTWARGAPRHVPPAVTGPCLFTDPVNGHVDMVGGFDGRLYQYRTFQWTGAEWRALRVSASPTARAAAACALDRPTRRAVLFGGLGDLNTYDTWTFDGRTWERQTPVHQPPQRFNAMTTYDPRQRGVFVFGGGSASGMLADNWLWTGTDWRELKPTDTPSARESSGMAFDPRTRSVVLFGGDSGEPILDDTWGI